MSTRGAAGRWKNDQPIDYDWLRQKYVAEKLTAKEIGLLCGRGEQTIQYHIREKLKIKMRGTRSPRAIYKDSTWLRREYEEKRRTLRDVAYECRTSMSVIGAWLRRFSIPIRYPAKRIFGDEKLCLGCERRLPLSAFSRKRDRRRPDSDGLQNVCKACDKERYGGKRSARARRPEIRERNRVVALVWGRSHRERTNAARRRWWSRNHHRVDVRINNAMGSMICASLRGKKGGRHWETLVGYTTAELRNHLESHFEPWMTWENWGRAMVGHAYWQIDHVIPRSAFNITSTDCDDFRRCWSLDNLRPLEAVANIRKGGVRRAIEG